MLISENIIIHGDRAIAKSFAKINLTLDVLGKLPNGYHEIESIMQTINLFDLIIIDKMHNGIEIRTNLKFLPTNEKNIAFKAAALFFKHTSIRGGARILIHKNIPVSAGLAGGSGNAAAVLAALNLLYDANIPEEEILKLASKLGADVPYCMIGGTMLAKGIGDILSRLPQLKKQIVLVVKPPIGASTAEIYEYLDSVTIEKRPNIAEMTRAIESSNDNGVAENLCNVMEVATIRLNPVIGGIKEKMLLNGARGALMSGSGSTVFGFFDDFETAKKSHDSFAKLYKDVFLTYTL